MSQHFEHFEPRLSISITGNKRFYEPPWYLAAAMLFVAMALAFTGEQPELRRPS